MGKIQYMLMSNIKPYWGSYPTTIDEKNRVIIPSSYRSKLETMIGPDSPLLISPQREGRLRYIKSIKFETISREEYEDKVQQMDNVGVSARLVDKINSQGKVTLGYDLVEFLDSLRGVEREPFFMGCGDYFELHKGDMSKVTPQMTKELWEWLDHDSP